MRQKLEVRRQKTKTFYFQLPTSNLKHKPMKLKYIFNKLIIFVAITATISACTKPNEEPELKKDNISGRRVRYTVMVVNAAFTGTELGTAIDSAMVSLVMNDSVYSVATDSSGIAKFNNLAAGVLAVRISHPKYATTNMIVDITATKDSSREYDANNLRNASTMVAMFPTEGKNTATISGKTFADLDLTLSGLETAIKGLNISAYIAQKQLINYINHKGEGKITSIVCDADIKNSTTDADGNYSIKVPAGKAGLKVVIVSDDFVYQQKTTTGTQRHVYKAKNDTVTVFSTMKRIHDIVYD